MELMLLIFLVINICTKVANFHLSKKLAIEATHDTRDSIGPTGYIDTELVSKSLFKLIL